MDNQNSDAPSNITINGQEFSPDDAQRYIELGRKTEEYESKWNTKLDNVWPEYGRKSEAIKQYERELEEAKAQLTELTTKQKEGIAGNPDVEQALQEARRLGIATTADLDKAGYIKQSDLESYLSRRDQEIEAKQQAIKAVLAEADKLSQEINGSDGRPKFNKLAVMGYARETGLTLKEAYEHMFEDDLKVWKEAQLEAQKRKELKTLKSGGEKSPREPRVSNSNFKDVLSEALWSGGSEE